VAAARTVSSIQSGRANFGLKPRRPQSRSEMFLRILCARSAPSSIFFSWSSVASLNSAWTISASRLYDGCWHEQFQQTPRPRATSITARSRCAGFFLRVAAWIALALLERPSPVSGSSPKIALHEKQTVRSTLTTVFMKETWYIGFASWMCPKCPGHSWLSIPQVPHLSIRSMAPSRGSLSPPTTATRNVGVGRRVCARVCGRVARAVGMSSGRGARAARRARCAVCRDWARCRGERTVRARSRCSGESHPRGHPP
jgi:hypothetical protein